MYMNVAQFRVTLKECLDLAVNGEVIKIERLGQVFELRLSGVGAATENREINYNLGKHTRSPRMQTVPPETIPGVFKIKDSLFCKHRSHPSLCKFKKNGKPCKE